MDLSVRCISIDAAIQFEFTLPGFFGHCSFWSLESVAPPTRIWEFVSRSQIDFRRRFGLKRPQKKKQ